MHFLKKLTLATAIAMTAFMPSAYADDSSSQISEVQMKVTNMGKTDPRMRYVTVHETGQKIRFDIERAKREGASAQILESGRLLNQYSREMQESNYFENREALKEGTRVSAASTVASPAASLPLWGNWCGPGHLGPGAPVDLLDAACMRHDICYGERGYWNCKCDQDFFAAINRDYDRMGGSEKAMANALYGFFKVASLFCRS